jgi:hypothetical protein
MRIETKRFLRFIANFYLEGKLSKELFDYLIRWAVAVEIEYRLGLFSHRFSKKISSGGKNDL